MVTHQNNYCALLVRAPNSLRLINSHPEVIDVIRKCLEKFGLDFRVYEQSKVTCGFRFSHCFFTRGADEEDAVLIRRTLANIVEDMGKVNWEVEFSSDIGRHRTNSCLFFSYNQNLPNEAKGSIFTFAPSGDHNALIIEVPNGLEIQLFEGIRNTTGASKHVQLASDSGKITSRVVLKDGDWRAFGREGILTRQMLLQMVKISQTHRFELVANMDIKGTSDSLMFQYRESLSGISSNFIIISLNGADKLRLIHDPSTDGLYHQTLVSTIEELIKDCWHMGLQGSEVKDGCHQFKLKGWPWWAEGKETVETRFLIANLIVKMKSIGWEVHGSLDVSRRMQDKSVFLFRQCVPEVHPYAVLSFHEEDRIRFQTNSNLSDQMINTIDKVLQSAEKIKRKQNYGRAVEWKVTGSPFAGSIGKQQRLMIHLLTQILSFFKSEGWQLVASVDVSAKYDKGGGYPLDNHSWFFLHDPSKKSANPVVLEDLLTGDSVSQILSEEAGSCTII